jgi:NMD protein affecting ribosome stability and mRNA decay
MMPTYQNTPKSKAVRMGTTAPRRQRSKKDEQEFGLAKKEFIICPNCNSVFFDKAWHHSLEEDAKHLTDKKNVRFKICPACRMAKDRTFEGELVISLSKEKLAEKNEIINVVKNSDKQARAHDPMDRVLWIEYKGSEIRVLTSENQLAVRMGKKLESAFKGGALEIKHSHGEDVIRVFWKY